MVVLSSGQKSCTVIYLPRLLNRCGRRGHISLSIGTSHTSDKRYSSTFADGAAKYTLGHQGASYLDRRYSEIISTATSLTNGQTLDGGFEDIVHLQLY